MNWIDALVLAILALTAFWGFRTGLIHMFVPLVAILVGLAISSRVAGPLGNLFGFVSENENVQTVLGFLALFIALLVIAVILGNVLRTLINFLPLAGLANGITGALIGLVIGCVLLSGVLTGLQKFPFGGLDETIEGSALGTVLADRFDVVTRGVGLIPRTWDQDAE